MTGPVSPEHSPRSALQGDFRVAEWLVQPSLGRISAGDRSVYLRAKVMDLLVYLASRHGEVVSKDGLLENVWRSEAITESALTRTVAELRQALGDDADHPRLIETIPKCGYRLLVRPEAVAGSEDHRSRLAIAAVLAIVIAGTAVVTAVAVLRSRRPASGIAVVAVVPFEYAGSDAGDRYLADGMHQEIIARLAMISGVRVIDRASMLRYRDGSVPTTEVASDLGADFVLRGTVKKDLMRIRFIAVLANVRNPADQWTDEYDRDLSVGNLVAVQSDVALRVAEELRAKITSAERARVSGRGTESAAAYERFLRAAQLPSDSDTRERLLEQAIALDPAFAAALAELAFTYVERSYRLGQPAALTDKGIALAQQAIAIDPALPSAYRALALGYLDQGRLEAAAGAYRRAMDLRSNDGDSLLAVGWIDYLRGRLADAVERWMAARALSPNNVQVYVDLSSAERLFGHDAAADQWARLVERIGGRPLFPVRSLMFQGRINTARERLQTALAAANPASAQALEIAAEVSLRAGDYTAALDALDRLARIATDDWNFWGLTYRTQRGYVLIQLGDEQEGRRLLDQTRQDALDRIRRGDERPGIKREIAAIHAALGDTAEACAWFERAIASGWRLESIHPSPLFASLGREPEFQRLMQTVAEDIRRANAEIDRRGLRPSAQ